MSGCLSLKQAQKKLKHAAPWFCELVTIALDHWQKTTQVLQGYPQYPCTEATSRLVEAALWDHPRSKVDRHSGWRGLPPQDQRAWVEKHLPGISKAMLECTRSQLEVTTKRISILQSLLKSGWQPDSTQFVARLQSERTAYIYIDEQWWVLCLILPVAVLCGGVAWLKNPTRDVTWCIDPEPLQRYHSQYHSRFELAREAPQVIAANLEEAVAVRQQLHFQVMDVQRSLSNVGLGVFDSRFSQAKSVAWFLLCTADMQWLRLATQLLPDCEWAVLLLKVMFWPLLHSTECVVAAHVYDEARSDVCCLLLHPGFLPALTKVYPLAFLGAMMVGLGFKVEHLQAAGVPEAIQQQLQPMLEYTGPWDPEPEEPEPCDSQLCADQHAASSSNITDSDQVVADDTAAATKTEPGVTLSKDEDWNDMNTLLQMMYGCSVQTGV